MVQMRERCAQLLVRAPLDPLRLSGLHGGRGDLAPVAHGSGRQVRRLGPSGAKGPAIRPLFHNLTRGRRAGKCEGLFLRKTGVAALMTRRDPDLGADLRW